MSVRGYAKGTRPRYMNEEKAWRFLAEKAFGKEDCFGQRAAQNCSICAAISYMSVQGMISFKTARRMRMVMRLARPYGKQEFSYWWDRRRSLPRSVFCAGQAALLAKRRVPSRNSARKMVGAGRNVVSKGTRARRRH